MSVLDQPLPSVTSYHPLFRTRDNRPSYHAKSLGFPNAIIYEMEIEYVKGYRYMYTVQKLWNLSETFFLKIHILNRIWFNLVRIDPNDWGFAKMTSSNMSLGTHDTTILSEVWRQSEFKETRISSCFNTTNQSVVKYQIGFKSFRGVKRLKELWFRKWSRMKLSLSKLH